jgi:molecular chaperone DnaK (HSP70)
MGAMDLMPAPVGGYSLPPGVGGSKAPPPVLVDVTPRALLVEVVGGYTDTIIPRNAKIPCERRREFTTGSDYQTVVRVRVAQGERPTFLENTYLGEVELSGLRPALRGEVKIGVTFELDADGSLRVRAQDLGTGAEAAALLQLVAVATDETSLIQSINRVNSQPIGQGLF